MSDDLDLTTGDLQALLDSWLLSLRSDRKAESTITHYMDGVRQYLELCEQQELPPMHRASLRTFVTHLIEAGREPATARSRHLAVRRYSAWLAEEGEIERDPFLGVKPPKLDVKVTQPLTDEQLSGLLKACQPPPGADRAAQLRHRRDEAIVRFMLETGARAGEVAALQLADVDLQAGSAVIRRGKGGKGRVVPFGPTTAKAIDRYLRLRRQHRLAESPALWLGDRGKAFTYDALHKSLAQRAAAAGIDGFHPHLMRHTAAHRWLARGGSEGGLMAVAGWQRPDMLIRYTKARAAERAAEEARGLNLGDYEPTQGEVFSSTQR